MNNLQCWVSWLLTLGANIPLPLMPTIPTEFQQYVLIMKYSVLSLSSGMVIFLSSYSMFMQTVCSSHSEACLSPIPLSSLQGILAFCPPSKERKVKKVKSLSVSVLCDPMDCSLPGSSVHGIFQARVLEWVTIAFCRGSSWPRDRTWVSHTAGRLFTIRTTRKACLPSKDNSNVFINLMLFFKKKQFLIY